MRRSGVGLSLAGVALLALVACGDGNREPLLMNLRSTTDGPDEFAILPPKALIPPPDLTALPEPTPGGANLTDPQPLADAIAALGGTAPVAGAGIPAGDGALVSYAARQGRAGDIRSSLAAEDLEFRRRHGGRLLERAFGVSTYFRAYADYWLDQQAELARWRAAGAATPSAPPADGAGQ